MDNTLRELCDKEDFKSIQQFFHDQGQVNIDEIDMALRVIASTNNTLIAQFLIEKGATNVTEALSEATSQHGTDDMITLLLQHGANPQNWMAMEYAIQQEEFHAVQLLINAGFNEWSKALISSVHHKKISFVHLFLQHHRPSPDELERLSQSLSTNPHPEIYQLLGLP